MGFQRLGLVGAIAIAMTGALPAYAGDLIDCQAILQGSWVAGDTCDSRQRGDCTPVPTRLSPADWPAADKPRLLLPIERRMLLDPGAIVFRWLPVAGQDVVYHIRVVAYGDEDTTLAEAKTKALTWQIPTESLALFKPDQLYKVFLGVEGGDPNFRTFGLRSSLQNQALRDDLSQVCRRSTGQPRRRAIDLAKILGPSATAIATLEAAMGADDRSADRARSDASAFELNYWIARWAVELGWREKAEPAIERALAAPSTEGTPEQRRDLERWQHQLKP